MALLKNVEVHYARLVRPNSAYNPTNPTWEVQIRTSDPAQKKALEEQGVKMKLAVHKSGDQEGLPMLDEKGNRFWRTTLKKKSIAKDGKKANPPQVVDGRLKEIDGDSIGNGSICNIRVFQYEYQKDGKTGIANVLMAVQVVKHLVYTPAVHDDEFEECDTEVVGDDDFFEANATSPSLTPPAPSGAKKPSVQLPDSRGDDEF